MLLTLIAKEMLRQLGFAPPNLNALAEQCPHGAGACQSETSPFEFNVRYPRGARKSRKSDSCPGGVDNVPRTGR